MEVFRLAREKFADLSGRGSALKGARWNSPGVELIYTAQNRSLAMAEVAVHFTLATLPSDYFMLTLYIPDHTSLVKIEEFDLSFDWNSFPHPISNQYIGDRFVADHTHCVLKVPSAVTKGDFNLLINPRHLEFTGIKIIDKEKFPFDKRIFK